MLSITLLTIHAAAQEFGQRPGVRGVVSKKNKPIELNEVPVSASLGKETYASATKQITILTAKEIQELPVVNINELLEYVAGVDMRQRGPLDVQGDMGIRGGTFDQTLVLVNGVRMNNPQTGHHNMNLPVPLSMIERIEVVHGGATNVHGIGAMTGVLNIVLKSPQKKINAGYALTTGQHNLINSSFYIGKKVGKWGVQFGQQSQESSGYISNTDFESRKFIVNLSRVGDKEEGTLSIFYAENQKAFGAQNYYSSAFPDQFEATSTRVIATGYEVSFGQKTDLILNLNFVLGTDRFELFRESDGLGGFDASIVAYDWLPSGRYFRAADGDSADAWYNGPNFHQTMVHNGNIRLSHRWTREHETSFGYNWRGDNIISNVLGVVGEGWTIRGWDRYYYDKEEYTSDFSWFGEHKFTRGRYQLRAGGMLNSHWRSLRSLDKSYFFAPSVDFLYRLTKTASIYTTINRSMRYPTYTDLYYNRGGAQGSIGLKPETAWNYEVGYKAKEGDLYINGALFHRRSKDLIDWVTYVDIPDTAFASNITALALTGIEAGLSYAAKKRKQLLRRASVEAALMTGIRPEVDYSSLYALDYLRAKITARATQKLGMGFFTNYALTIQDRMGTYNSLGTEVDYKPFALLDLKLYYAPAAGIFKRQFPFQAFINITNAMDINYYDRGNVVQPGRWISTGFELRFR